MPAPLDELHPHGLPICHLGQDVRVAVDLAHDVDRAIRRLAEEQAEGFARRPVGDRAGRDFSLRLLFADLMLDEPIVELFRTRDDFANLRLALRRTLTEKPLGTDYSDDGNFPPEFFEKIFSDQVDESAQMPDYMQQAADKAILAYYQQKDIRQIDYAIDAVQAEYNLKEAHQHK